MLLHARYKVEVKYIFCELTVDKDPKTLYLDINSMEYVP